METAAAATPASASPLAIVVMGVSGSGKTTIAQALATHYGFRFLDADDYHSVAARAQMASGQPLTDAMRYALGGAAVGDLARLCAER